MSQASSNSNSNSISISTKPMSFTLGTKRPTAQVKALFSDDGEDDGGAKQSPVRDAAHSLQGNAPNKETDTRSTPREKRSRWGQSVAEEPSASITPNLAPHPQIDPEVVKVIEKTAEYVSRAGPSLEIVIRTKQQDNPQFRFLFDESIPEALLYRSKLQQLTASQKQITSSNSGSTTVENASSIPRTTPSGRVSKFSSVPIDQGLQPPGYVPTTAPTATLVQPIKPAAFSAASALPTPPPAASAENHKEDDEEDEGSDEEAQLAKYQRILDAYRRQQPPPKKQETPEEDGIKHHIGHFIPKEELEKFMTKAAQVTGRTISAFANQQTPVQTPTLGEENVGHKLMAKMGWQQGQKLGINGNGLEKPIEAAARDQPLGIGAHAVGDVQPEDDEFEIYRKRMMLSYRYRPNPLGNPRKQYY